MKSRRQAHWMLGGAVFIAASFVCCHLGGLRESTSWLCRIDASFLPSMVDFFGLGLYLVSYLGLVIAAPILAIAAGLLFLYSKLVDRRSNPPKGAR